MIIIGLISLAVGKPGDIEQVEPGKPVSLSDTEAQSLIGRGHAVSANEQPDAEDVVSDIIDAIAQISPDDFGKDGKPNVKSIETFLGIDITAKQRDMAWKLMKEGSV